MEMRNLNVILCLTPNTSAPKLCELPVVDFLIITISEKSQTSRYGYEYNFSINISQKKTNSRKDQISKLSFLSRYVKTL